MIRHLFCIAAASALLAPTVPRAAPAAPLSMGVEVGGGIKTVSATIAAFEQNYPRPVATLWRSVHKSKFYGAFVLILRVSLHVIDATPARWRGDAGSSPLDRARSAARAPDTLVDLCADRHSVATGRG